MTRVQVERQLHLAGVKLELQSIACLTSFCAEMGDCQYGVEETANAFHWFRLGWERSDDRLLNPPG